MKSKFTISAASIAILTASTIFAHSASIEGNWKTEAGAIANISKCGSSYCIKLKTGDYAGKSIGKLSGTNDVYKGTVTDPTDDKQYSGSATVSGNSLKLKGCAFKVFCKTQNWTKK